MHFASVERTMAYTNPKNRAEAETALDAGRLFVQISAGRWWVARRNGATATWKKNPARFSIPIKMGINVYHKINEINVANVSLFRIAASQDEATT